MKKMRYGFSLAELLVVIAILCVLMALLLPAIQRTRESANQVACANHLKQLGLAIHLYHDSHGMFPDNRDAADRPPFYQRIKPYVEQAGNDGTVAAAVFFCPSRRTTAAGAKDDYATGWGTSIGMPFLNIIATSSPLDVTIGMVNRADGCSNTLLLMHKGMEPQFYYTTIQPPTDAYPPDYFSWYDCGWGAGIFSAAADAFRSPFVHLRDRDGGYDIEWFTGPFMPYAPCYFLMTSPHSTSAPSLFGDGSVRALGYIKNYNIGNDGSGQPVLTPEAEVLVRLWNAIDGIPTSPEDLATAPAAPPLAPPIPPAPPVPPGKPPGDFEIYMY